MHKKGITEEVAKKRSRKNTKVQVGYSAGAGMAGRCRECRRSKLYLYMPALILIPPRAMPSTQSWVTLTISVESSVPI